MNTASSPKIVVFMRLSSLQEYLVAGTLWQNEKGYCFCYDHEYLRRDDAIPIDPWQLPLSDDEFINRELFSALRDAAPDRWGRRVLSWIADHSSEKMSEIEILTAVHYPQRIGALAFGSSKTHPESLAPWTASQAVFTAPEDIKPLANIVGHIDRMEDDEIENDQCAVLDKNALQTALAASLSLGGARPKALVIEGGQTWIAKFSSCEDTWREPIIEQATMTLAAKCGITVAQTRLTEVDGQPILLVKRFDRLNGVAHHFVSGFTVTGANEDGNWGSYQNLAEKARLLGDKESGPEIFRRMVFNALCSNRDDHLRNHAFFVTRDRIAMTPAYDLVPSQIRCKEWQLSLVCGLEGRVATKSNLLSDVQPFGLSSLEAGQIWDEMTNIVAGWREHFTSCGVTQHEMEDLKYRFLLVGS